MLKNETALEKLTNENLAIAQKITEIVVETSKIIEVAIKAFQEKNQEIRQLLQEQIDLEEKKAKSENRDANQQQIQENALNQQKEAAEKLQQALEAQRAAVNAQIGTVSKQLESANKLLKESNEALAKATTMVTNATEKFESVQVSQATAKNRLTKAETAAADARVAIAAAGREYNAAKKTLASLNKDDPDFAAAQANVNTAKANLDVARTTHATTRQELADAKKELGVCNLALNNLRDLKMAQREEIAARLIVAKNQQQIDSLNASLAQLNRQIDSLSPDKIAQLNADQVTALATQQKFQPTPKPQANFGAIPATSMAGTTTCSFNLTKNGPQFNSSSYQTFDIRGNQIPTPPGLQKNIEKVEKALFNKFLSDKGLSLDTQGIKKNGKLIDDNTFNQLQQDYTGYRNDKSLTAMADQMKDQLGGTIMKFSLAPKPGVAKTQEQEKKYEETAYASRAMQPKPSGQARG